MIAWDHTANDVFMLVCVSCSAATRSANTRRPLRVFALQIGSMPTCALCLHRKADNLFNEQVSVNNLTR